VLLQEHAPIVRWSVFRVGDRSRTFLDLRLVPIRASNRFVKQRCSSSVSGTRLKVATSRSSTTFIISATTFAGMRDSCQWQQPE
jgi:hypothetical protein